MNLIPLKCNNCDAMLEIDPTRLIAYCPYCGQKLLLDMEQVGAIFAEREKTKQEIEKTKQTTIRAQEQHDREVEITKRKKHAARSAFWQSDNGRIVIIFLVFFLLIGLLILVT